MNLPTLYEISNQYKEALEKLGDMELDEQTIADTLEGLKGTLEAKAENVAAFVGNLEALAESMQTAEQKLAHRRKVLENRIERIKDYIKSCMETNGIKKIECPYFKLAIKTNPARVVIDDETKIPPEFVRIPELPPPQPDKKEILEFLKKSLKSVEWAHLEKGTRLDISL